MLGAIYIGLSGMDAYSKGLQMIGNNVANLNSIGYKSTSVSFQDMYSYLGGGYSLFNGASSDESGSGVRFGQSRIDFQQGELQQTDGDLDLAIQGNGFLTLLNGDNVAYGRTGQFTLDQNGYITLNGTDYHLATIDASGQAVAFNIGSERTDPPVSTTAVSFSGNLLTTETDDRLQPMTVFDSNGVKHTWTTELTPVAGSTTGQWTVTITDETGATVGTSTLNFINGNVDPTSSTITVMTTPTGASPMSVTLDFAGVTSNANGATSTLQAGTPDGHAGGQYESATVDPATGQIKVTYSNGNVVSLASVALANFVDPEMLQRSGGGLFQNNSGAQFRMLASGADGVGKVVSRQIEASNVDLTAEFGELILVQRGFQASSQVVSVSNDMIQQLFGIRGQG